MSTSYNRIAGQSIERLAALSDGLFAVAMTLLVLDLHAPAAEAVRNDHELGVALLALAPRLLVYLMSFLTLGIFWVGQQTQLNHMARSDRDYSWLQLGFLFAVSLMPFSTALMAEFVGLRVALLLYWANILLLGGALFSGWHYARRAGLLRRRRAARYRYVDNPTHRHRPGALRLWRTALRVQHVLEPRLHPAGAAELRRSASHRHPRAPLAGARTQLLDYLRLALRRALVAIALGLRQRRNGGFDKFEVQRAVLQRHLHRPALGQRPNSSSSASGFLMCSWITRARGRAP